MPYIKFDKPTEKNRQNSPSGFLSYMSKEDKARGILEKEHWFNSVDNYISDYQVLADIENQRGLRSNDFKYYTGSVSFSEEELIFLNNSNDSIKRFGKALISVFAENFNRGLSASDLRFYCKLESNRYYKGTDKEVVARSAKAGDKKPGLYHKHLHFILGRTTREINKVRKISPISNHINTQRGCVTGGFSRNELKGRTEQLFDSMFNYNRPINHTYQHLKAVSPGKDFNERLNAISQSVDISQSQLKYGRLSLDDRAKKLAVLMNYMKHGLKTNSPSSIQLNSAIVLKEAKNRNYNGDVYKSLLNMNYRLKNGFKPNQDLTPFIIEYARFVGAPYSKLPNSLKEDRFMRYVNIINQHLPKENKLDSYGLFQEEMKFGLNGKVYRALGEFNKLLKEDKTILNANKLVIELAEGKKMESYSSAKQRQPIQSAAISDSKHSPVSDLNIGSINGGNSASAYKEEEIKKKKKRPHHRL